MGFCCVTVMSYRFSISQFFFTRLCARKKHITYNSRDVYGFPKPKLSIRRWAIFPPVGIALSLVENESETTLKFDIFFNLKTNEVQDVYRLLIKRSGWEFSAALKASILPCLAKASMQGASCERASEKPFRRAGIKSSFEIRITPKHYFAKVFFFFFLHSTAPAADSCKLSTWNLRSDVRVLATERLEPAQLPRDPPLLAAKELGLQAGRELLKFLHRAHVLAMRCTGCEKTKHKWRTLYNISLRSKTKWWY